METGPVTMARRPARRPSISVTELNSARRESVCFMTGLPENGHVLTQATVWKPLTAHSRKERKGEKNVIDGRSLYAVRRENIASREMAFVTSAPGEQGRQPVTNVEHLVEKNYIINSRLSHATPEKFPNVIMSRFNRVSDHDEAVSYGMPRPPTRSYFQKVMDNIKREPSCVNIKQFPSLHEPISCSNSDEFCEILGPSSCQDCIENTNRAIGEQLQEMVFPTIDISTSKLIAPKMAKLLRKGHRQQVRRRRLRELGFDGDVIEISPGRDGSRSAGTCSRCKRVINSAKIKITSPSEHGSRLYTKYKTRNDRF